MQKLSASLSSANRPKRPILNTPIKAAAILILLVSAALAGYATHLIGASPIEIGVEFRSRQKDAPLLASLGGGQEVGKRFPLERVALAASPQSERFSGLVARRDLTQTRLILSPQALDELSLLDRKKNGQKTILYAAPQGKANAQGQLKCTLSPDQRTRFVELFDITPLKRGGLRTFLALFVLSSSGFAGLILGGWVTARILRSLPGQPLPVKAVTGAYLLLALAALGLLPSRIGSSMIDVGLDLDARPKVAPTLSYPDPGTGRMVQQPMEMISQAFAANKETFFELTATGQKNPASPRAEVWLTNTDDFKNIIQDPPDSWDRVRSSLVSSPEKVQPATLRWRGVNESPMLSFGSHKWSGIAKLRTLRGEQTIDLYAEESSRTTVLIPTAGKGARYHGHLPRRAIGQGWLTLTDSRRSIARLFIGTLKPTIYFASNNAPGYAWGNLTEGWQPPSTGGRIALEAFSPLEQGGMATRLALAAALWAGLLLVVGGSSLALRLLGRLLRQRAPTRELAPFSLGQFLIFFIPLALSMVFTLACFYPGIMTGDSIDHWRQAHTLDLADYHPILYTLTIRGLTSLWDSPAIVVLVQILILSAAVGYGFSLLLRAGLSLHPILVLFPLVLLSPRNQIYTMTIWKDIIFSAMVLILTIMLAHYLLDRRKSRSWLYWILLGVVLALVPLFRHNGLLILVGLLPLLFIFFWTARTRVVITALTCVVVFAGAKWGLYPMIKVKPISDPRAMIYTCRLAALVGQDAPFAQKEYEFLNKVRNYSDRWGYSAVTPNLTVAYPAYHNGFATANFKTYQRLYYGTMARYPLLFVRHYLKNTAYLYWPKRIAEDYGDPFAVGITRNDYGLVSQPRLTAWNGLLTDWLNFTVDQKAGNFFWRPAIHLYLLLLAAWLLVRRTRDYRFLIVFAPVALNTLSLFMASLSQCVRYQLPLTLAISFLIGLLWIPPSEPPAEDRDEGSRISERN